MKKYIPTDKLEWINNIKIEVYYRKAGYSYYSWEKFKWWVALFVRWVELNKNSGCTTESHSMFLTERDGSILLLELNRKSQKQIDLIGEKIKQIPDGEIEEAYINNSFHALLNKYNII